VWEARRCHAPEARPCTRGRHARATISVVSAWDDDDWTGEPPEGRHPASRADPGFWRDHVPLSITGVGLGIALIILLIVWLL
jgi:hypothetical protein